MRSTWLENEVKGNKYGNMVKSMSNGQSGIPATEASLQFQAGGGGKKLKRERAIADINMLYKKVAPANPNPNNNMAQNDINDLMEIDIFSS